MHRRTLDRIVVRLLADAATCPAVLAIVGLLAAGKDVRELGQRIRNVDVLSSQEQARPLPFGYRVGGLVHVHERHHRCRRTLRNMRRGVG